MRMEFLAVRVQNLSCLLLHPTVRLLSKTHVQPSLARTCHCLQHELAVLTDVSQFLTLNLLTHEHQFDFPDWILTLEAVCLELV